MGLPGSGKTTLAQLLNSKIHSKWYNADAQRSVYQDWDFSSEGRIRQAVRMRGLADDSHMYGFKLVFCDFVAPTEEIRNIFDADYTIWMDTIAEGRYEDTNKLFETPSRYDIRITNFDQITPEFINQIISILLLKT